MGSSMTKGAVMALLRGAAAKMVIYQ